CATIRRNSASSPWQWRCPSFPRGTPIHPTLSAQSVLVVSPWFFLSAPFLRLLRVQGIPVSIFSCVRESRTQKRERNLIVQRIRAERRGGAPLLPFYCIAPTRCAADRPAIPRQAAPSGSTRS